MNRPRSAMSILELPAARKRPPLIRLLPLGQLSDVQRGVYPDSLTSLTPRLREKELAWRFSVGRFGLDNLFLHSHARGSAGKAWEAVWLQEGLEVFGFDAADDIIMTHDIDSIERI